MKEPIILNESLDEYLDLLAGGRTGQLRHEEVDVCDE